MMTITQAIGAVLGGTLAGGVAGSGVGALIGWLAPSFIRWLPTPVLGEAPHDSQLVEFAFGLGSVSGLFMGAGASLILIFAIPIRDALAPPQASRKTPLTPTRGVD